MSLHKNPDFNSDAIIDGLKLHGLKHDTPSQLADAFRQGYVYAVTPPRELTRTMDAAGVPKVKMTLLEREALAVLNTVKAWRDSDGNEGFPYAARERIDVLLMTFEQRRLLNPSLENKG